MNSASLLDSFLDEAAEHLDTLSREILRLERDPSRADAVRRMFIAAHSLKAGAAIVGLDAVRDLAHAVEDVLTALESGENACTPDIADVLLASVDALRALLFGGSATDSPTIDVNVADLTMAVHSLARPSGRQTAGPPLRVMVVEDSPTVRLLETIVLRDEGFAVETFESAAVALEHLCHDGYDLVVTGLETRGVGDIDFVTALRAQPGLGSLAVIVTDTEDDPVQRQRLADLGVTEFVRTNSLRTQSLSRAARRATR